MLIPSDKIYLADSKIAGRGVFAKADIKMGEIIEEAPVIVIPFKERYVINPDISRYVFEWKIPGQETIALIMGLGSFYNHSITPNASYRISILNRTMFFYALCDIKKDQEITHNYGYKIRPEDIRK